MSDGNSVRDAGASGGGVVRVTVVQECGMAFGGAVGFEV